NAQQRAELAALWVAACGVGMIAFGSYLGELARESPLGYLAFPIVILSALRHGAPAATLAVLPTLGLALSRPSPRSARRHAGGAHHAGLRAVGHVARQRTLRAPVVHTEPRPAPALYVGAGAHRPRAGGAHRRAPAGRPPARRGPRHDDGAGRGH